MRLLLFPALDQIYRAINGRSTGDRRYNWKSVVFSLKNTKAQRDIRNQIARDIDERIEQMKSQGLSTLTSLGDISLPHIRKLYVTFIMLLNTTYPDYDFTSTSLDCFIPTTNQQFYDQLSADVFAPLATDLATETPLIGDTKQLFHNALKDAIGFDLHPPQQHIPPGSEFPPQSSSDVITTTNNNNNNNNTTMDDVQSTAILIPQHTISPHNSHIYDQTTSTSTHILDTSMISNTSSTASIKQQQNQQQQYVIVELDNDGDNPLFSSLKLWTKVYLIYNAPLKRTALLCASCKSTQTLYSPAVLPLKDGERLDEFKLFTAAVPNRRRRSSRANDSDDDDDDENGDDNDDNNDQYDEKGFSDDYYDDDDDDMNNNDPYNMQSPRTDDVHSDSEDDDFYLYTPAAVVATGSVGAHSHASRIDHDLSITGESAGTYTNHVELVENSHGEIEIIPLIIDPRQLQLLQRQEQQDSTKLPQHTPNPYSNVRNNHNNSTMNQTPDFQSIKTTNNQ